MRYFFIFAIFLFSDFECFSQIEFEKGYFISNSGERNEVLIKNVDWKNNPEIFSYKQSRDSEILSNTIEEAKEFKVNDYY